MSIGTFIGGIWGVYRYYNRDPLHLMHQLVEQKGSPENPGGMGSLLYDYIRSI